MLRSLLNAGLKTADGAAAWGRMAVDDFAHLGRTLDGDDLDAWDPDYIRRVLPLWRAVLRTYFRGEVRGLENIPEEGPCLLVGNHSGGIMIVDTFVFAVGFYERFGPERRFHQLAHDMAARWAGTRPWAGGGGGGPRTTTRARRSSWARRCSSTRAATTRRSARPGTRTGS